MKIAISNPQFYFSFFYVLSFLVTLIFVIIYSKRHKIQIWTVLLMLTTVTLCTIIGSRLATIPFSEWVGIIKTGSYEGFPGRFAVGGLFFGLAALLFSIKILGINKQIIILYAWITPLCFGIQKIGCFLNGCCYGNPSGLPWSVSYPVGTNAHFQHLLEGRIDPLSIYSLSVHPVQLYEVICLIAISYLVWRSQKFWKNAGSPLIFALGLFFIFRFFIGFLRDSATPGINMLQWLFLASGVISAILIILFENHSQSLPQKNSDSLPTLNKSILYIIIVSAVAYIFRGLFTPYEILSINAEFVPAVLLSAYYCFKSLKEVKVRLVTASFFIIPLFFIIQIYPPDTTNTEPKKGYYTDEIKSYQKIDFGFSIGEYNNSIKYQPEAGWCGTYYSSEDYMHLYRMAQVGYSKINYKENYIKTTGINLYGGINTENNLTKGWKKSYFLVGINPFVKYDSKWAGIGGSVHLGNLRWIPGSPMDKESYDKGTWFSPVMPGIYLRLGKSDILDLKYTYGFNNPTTLPLLSHEISIGSGIGQKTDYGFRLGTAITKNYGFPFISAEGLLGNQFGINIRYDFGNGEFYNLNPNVFVKNTGRIQFGANYRF